MKARPLRGCGCVTCGFELLLALPKIRHEEARVGLPRGREGLLNAEVQHRGRRQKPQAGSAARGSLLLLETQQPAVEGACGFQPFGGNRELNVVESEDAHAQSMRFAGPRRHNPRVTDAPQSSLRLTVALFLGVLVVVLLNLPTRTYGDDIFFIWFIVRDQVFTSHFLFTPLARGWAWVFAHLGVDPLMSLRLLAAVSTALGIALLAAAARRRGATSRVATATALLTLTASASWFFAGAAEVHAVQLAAFGFLAWVAAGLRPDMSPLRPLGLALAFGLAVGAHRSSGILLPGVVLAYAFFTPGRPTALRLRDTGAFAAGGVVSLATMFLVQWSTTGSALTAQEDSERWSKGLSVQLERLDASALATYLAESWIAPAFALTVLGAAAIGVLARTRPWLALALVATVIPHAIFFALFQWEERGAYFIVTLPLFAWAAARVNAFGGAAIAIAAVGALFRPEELFTILGTGGLLASIGIAFGIGLVPLRRDLVSPGRATWLALALVACQLVGSQRELAHWDEGSPMLDWGRDTVAATGEDSVLVCAGFQQYFLLMLLARPWESPYAGTWAFQEELSTLGPYPFDVGYVAPQLIGGIERYLDQGKRIFVLEAVFVHFESDHLRGQYVRAIREGYDLVPVQHGAFDGYEILRKGSD